MAVVGSLVNDWLDRVDHHLLAAGYRAASVRADHVREALRRERAPFVDPLRSASPTSPGLPLVDRTARILVEVAAEASGHRSGIAGLVGAMSLPAEVALTTLGSLRLAQRLCVVYGFDPHDDRGRMALCQALAAAYDVELPDTGPEGVRVTDLPGLAQASTLPASASARLTRAMTSASARSAMTMRRRWFPLLGAPRQSTLARQRTRAAGERMIEVLRRLSEAPGPTRARVEDALEVPSP